MTWGACFSTFFLRWIATTYIFPSYFIPKLKMWLLLLNCVCFLHAGVMYIMVLKVQKCEQSGVDIAKITSSHCTFLSWESPKIIRQFVGHALLIPPSKLIRRAQINATPEGRRGLSSRKLSKHPAASLCSGLYGLCCTVSVR